LLFNPDTPTHANAAAAFVMPIDAMQSALAATRPAWVKLSAADAGTGNIP
jgi:hypothetical protein